MNKCATCKYWYVNAHAIGFGVCRSTARVLMTPTQLNLFFTAWNFGCVAHESGERLESIWTDEEIKKIATEFMKEYHT
jgi:hypothetical protein